MVNTGGKGGWDEWRSPFWAWTLFGLGLGLLHAMWAVVFGSAYVWIHIWDLGRFDKISCWFWASIYIWDPGLGLVSGLDLGSLLLGF